MTARGYGSFLISLVLAGVLTGCQKTPAPPPIPKPSAPPAVRAPHWPSFRDDFLEAYFKAEPAFAVTAGRHEFDGQLPDWSASGIAHEIARLHAVRERTLEFKITSLKDDERLERDNLVARIDRDLFWAETAEAPFRNPAFYIEGLDPNPYLTRNYAPLEQRLRVFIGFEHAVATAAAAIKANMRLPLPRALLERGYSAAKGFADFYHQDVPKIFASVADQRLRREFRQSNAEAEAAMRALAAFFAANRAGASNDFALGEARFARMLVATERVTTPLAELEAAGRADLDRNLLALKEACAALLPGKPVPSCVAKVEHDKPAGGAVAGARRELDELRSFIEAKGVVSIPGTEQALVNEAPPYNRANFAYIDIPGPYEKGLPSVYYISPPDPSWSAQAQRNYLPGRARLLFTSVHEVWPGHFLQFLHSNRKGSVANRVFVSYAFAEGWAHYGEEMMWEEGLGAGDAQTHVGQLLAALLRDVRFVSAIGVHTHGMTLAESERLFREQAYADEGSARQQAERAAYDPAYLNYTLGKLMIRKLRADWTASRGGRAAWRGFHDQFLSYGGPPIPLVRAAMLGNDTGRLF